MSEPLDLALHAHWLPIHFTAKLLDHRTACDRWGKRPRKSQMNPPSVDTGHDGQMTEVATKDILLNWDVFVTPGIPVVTRAGVPPGSERRMFSPISSTLIYGKRDAVLVDTRQRAPLSRRHHQRIAHARPSQPLRAPHRETTLAHRGT
jgi:hypothetical protein